MGPDNRGSLNTPDLIDTNVVGNLRIHFFLVKINVIVFVSLEIDVSAREEESCGLSPVKINYYFQHTENVELSSDLLDFE